MARTKAVLIIGGSGFIGTQLALRLREGYKVFATYHSHPILIPGVTTLPFAVENRNWVKRIVYSTQPDVIIYAAGSNDVAKAEAKPREAEQIHTGGPATVSNIAGIFNTKFIYISNAHVFDGERGNFHEDDTILPVTALGKAKAGGENFIRGKSLNYVIVRSSPVFGRGNGLNLSFMDGLRMCLDRGIKLEVPSGERHSFAHVEGLVDLVSRLIETGMRNRVVHYGGLTTLTYLEFCRRFATRFGFDLKLISAAAQIKRKGAHGGTELDYSLNCTEAAKSVKIKPLSLEESFEIFDRKMRHVA